MTILHSRPIGIGGDQLIFTSNDSVLVDRIESLFAELPDARNNIRQTWTIHIERVEAGPNGDPPGTFQTSSPFDEAVVTSPDLDRHERFITRHVNRLKIHLEADLVHLHSGAVSRGSRALVLAGESGAGKSTITAGLVRDGWSYITDDQVAVRLPDGELIPHRRPISLRRATWHEFAEVSGVPDPATDDRSRVQIPSHHFGGAQPTDRVFVTLIIRVQRNPQGETRLQVAPRQADAVRDIVAQSFDVFRYGIARLDATISLLARQPIYDLAYGDLNDAHRLAFRALEDAVDNAASTVLHEPPRAVDPVDSEHITRGPDVHGWRFDDGTTLLLNQELGLQTTLSIDERALWELLATPIKLDDMLRPVPEGEASRQLRRWIQTLTRGGFLIRG